MDEVVNIDNQVGNENRCKIFYDAKEKLEE